ESNIRLEGFNRLSQRGLQAISILVLDASIFDEQTEKKISIRLLIPAQSISLAGKSKRPRRRQLDAGTLLDFIAEPIHSALFKNIFQPGMLAICTITEVAVNRDHRLCDGFQMFGRQKTNDVSDARKRLRISVGHTKAAAGEQIVAGKFSI